MLLRSMTRGAFVAACLAALASGCSKSAPSSGSGGDTKGAASTPAAKPLAHITGDNYKVDTSATCAGGECVATVRLEATGEYHLNESYPYKLKANPTDGVTYKGTDPSGANVFTRANGDFAKQTEKVGVMTVKLAAGKPTTVTGTFKMSVCSAANCELEQPDVAIDVTP